jgi:hypothetical protein
VGHVTTPELPSQEGRVRSHGTRGSTESHMRSSPLLRSGAATCHMAPSSAFLREAPMLSHVSKEVKSRATEHVTAPKLTSVRRRGSKLRDTWRRQNSHQQGGEVQGHRTCDGSGAYLYRKVWSEATAYVTTRECTYCSLSWVPSIQVTDTPNFL